MRWAFALGLVALFACGGEPTTSPEAGAVSLKKSASTLLPSATDPNVQTEFKCGPSYPTDGGVTRGWCTDFIKLVWLERSGKNQWIFGWKVEGEFPGDTLFFTYGPYHSPKPIFHHDGIYQFNSINVTVENGRRYIEVYVQNSEPVNWGVFTKFK